MTKDLNVAIVSDLMRVYYTGIAYKMWLFLHIQHFKIITGIMTDNIIPRYIRFPGILYNF